METPLEKQKRLEEERTMSWLSRALELEKPSQSKKSQSTKIEKEEARQRLRDEKKFASTDELKAQMTRDVDQAKLILRGSTV